MRNEGVNLRIRLNDKTKLARKNGFISFDLKNININYFLIRTNTITFDAFLLYLNIFSLSEFENYLTLIMDVKIEEGWKKALAEEFEKPYFKTLTDMVRREYADPGVAVYPPASKIFEAFNASPFNQTKVVIIGQDPYHGPGQANGLCFSVNPGIDMPPSLKNIFKEVAADTGAPIPIDGDLSRWARQGVLLLNSSLTVRAHSPKSHAGIGWEKLTDAAVRKVAALKDNVVFILWGSDAIRKGEFIDRTRHLVLTSPHPSPLSAHRGFFGNRHFSKTNEYLMAHDKAPVIW